MKVTINIDSKTLREIKTWAEALNQTKEEMTENLIYLAMEQIKEYNKSF